MLKVVLRCLMTNCLPAPIETSVSIPVIAISSIPVRITIPAVAISVISRPSIVPVVSTISMIGAVLSIHLAMIGAVFRTRGARPVKFPVIFLHITMKLTMLGPLIPVRRPMIVIMGKGTKWHAYP